LKRNQTSYAARYLTRARQKAHQREVVRRSRRHRRPRGDPAWQRRPASRTTPAVATPAKPPVPVLAPESFDVVQNPEAFLLAFERLEEQMRKGRTPRLDFSQTLAVSSDAVLSMIAIASQLVRKYNVVVYLRWPTDPALMDVFRNCGLETYFKQTPPAPTDAGLIRQRLSKKVETKTAQEMIAFATQTLFGERRKEYATYSTFIECMGNTFEHSSKGGEGRELWWASVYCNADTGKVQCTFVDAGIGIFESIVFKGLLRKLAGGVKKAISRPALLRDLLERRIGSRTGESYRNRGMPKIYTDAKAGRISNLVIVTGSVYADVARDDFRSINRKFPGTFYYWEFNT
jgi:hypothetical protein